MSTSTRRRWLGFALIACLTIVIIIAAFGVYLAGEAGVLPWQGEPTRIAITPFADIPGFSTPVPESTPPAPS
jgi:hypothetical protein